ncbi:hypothetical protein VTP01DRAFT_4597 [Rhizomucor pusillus]|uniref:uncharacterized protein n=1 Tax=Rhizomucor pusillus TaxID=4840 RepID=UPI0037440D2A
MDMEITNTNDKMPNDIRDCWDRFKTQYPSAIFTQASIRRYANPLARAYQTLQTTYSNMMVEHFQDRVEKFVIFKLHRLIPNISNNLARKLANEYIYEDLAGGNPTIPEELQEDGDLDIILAIHTIQISLKDYIPEPCTTTEMAANPGRFIPALRFILSQYTLEHEQGNEKTCKTSPELFALTPQPSLHWRFVDIDAATLTVLDFNLYRFFDSEECMFTNMVTTNGFQLSLHFARPAKSPRMELGLSDFKEEEIENYFMPCALDPGRRDIFQAAYDAQNTEHEI